VSVSLRAMRYFTTALRLGSVSAAAHHLNVAASAISAAIDQIEAHFDLALATRQRARGIAATAEGKVMAAKFEALLEDYETILLDGVALKQSFRGDLRIGYYAPVAPAFLPQILAPLMRPEHDLTLHLQACDNSAAQEGLRRGDFDAILFVADEAGPDLTVVPLIEAPAYCLIPADHHLTAQDSVTLADLAQVPLAILNRPQVAEYYRRLFEETAQPIQVIAQSNSTEMIRSLVGRGLALAVLNMVPLTDVTYAGDKVVTRPISDDLKALTLSVAYRKAHPRRAVVEFVQQCKAWFAGPSAVTCPPTAVLRK